MSATRATSRTLLILIVFHCVPHIPYGGILSINPHNAIVNGISDFLKKTAHCATLVLGMTYGRFGLNFSVCHCEEQRTLRRGNQGDRRISLRWILTVTPFPQNDKRAGTPAPDFFRLHCEKPQFFICGFSVLIIHFFTNILRCPTRFRIDFWHFCHFSILQKVKNTKN